MELARAMFLVEVAKSVRHEARGIIDDIQIHLAIISRKLRDGVGDVDRDLEEASNLLMSLGAAIDKIRVAERPSPSILSVRSTWEEAQRFLSNRIANELVQVGFEGRDARVEVCGDWLHIALVNLIADSLDAFGRDRGKSGRSLILSVTANTKRDSVLLRYCDTATRIQAYRPTGVWIDSSASEVTGVLDIPKELQALGPRLALVKAIVEAHTGSIRMTRRTRGSIFFIDLPKRISRDTEHGN